MTVDDPPLDPLLASELDESVVQILTDWQKSSGIRLSFDAWLTAGYTKAKVAVVVASGNCDPKRMIIKACPPDRLLSREPQLQIGRAHV